MYLIGDFLIRIKNAYLAGKKELETPWSKMIEATANLLLNEGYLKRVRVVVDDTKKKKKVLLDLVYQGYQPRLTDIKIVSKPGRRVYVPCSRIPYSLGGQGVTIISTSQGVLTDKQARKKRLGGQVIALVW
ncbi:MAG: 30S ribosomal protein S8 [Patescibacteria group bacterium]